MYAQMNMNAHTINGDQYTTKVSEKLLLRIYIVLHDAGQFWSPSSIQKQGHLEGIALLHEEALSFGRIIHLTGVLRHSTN